MLALQSSRLLILACLVMSRLYLAAAAGPVQHDSQCQQGDDYGHKVCAQNSRAHHTSHCSSAQGLLMLSASKSTISQIICFDASSPIPLSHDCLPRMPYAASVVPGDISMPILLECTIQLLIMTIGVHMQYIAWRQHIVTVKSATNKVPSYVNTPSECFTAGKWSARASGSSHLL